MNASGWSRIGRALLAGVALLWAGLAAAKGPLYLWELRDGDGTLRAWLYGTIHVCDAACFPLPADVRAAFAGADSLALELDPEDPGLTRLLMQAARLPAGERLDDILPPALRPRVALAMDRLGLPRAVLQGMQPWMVSTLLTLKAAERAGYGAGQGIDLSLARDARARGIELWPLERVEQQVAALSAGGDKAQVAYLTEVVSLIEDDAAPEYFASMLRAWRTGDEGGVGHHLQPGDDCRVRCPGCHPSPQFRSMRGPVIFMPASLISILLGPTSSTILPPPGTDKRQWCSCRS